ncbi:MAG TPA: SelD-related putative sulfur metabolism protein [Nitrososphaera sp.]|nr:SelD-related putative sulfur metabolism protein [Nitrososphaera sp.]
MLDNFWEHVDQYRKLGFDPLRWIPTCSNEVDPVILRSALAEVKRASIKVSPSWFDPFYHIDGKPPELTRRIYDLANPVIDKEVEVKRALSIFRIHTGAGEYAPLLSEALQNFFKAFSAKVSVLSATATLTEHPEAQFAMFDYIELHRGDKVGYMPAVTSATQVIDITRAPDADTHSSIAMTSAIENLNLLGCGVSSSFKLFPVYDAPSEEILDRIRANLDAFTSRYNLAMEDYSSLKTNKLFYGTSAVAITNKELPTRYDQVEEGMEIMITNKFGGLPAVSLYTLGRMDSENIIKYEQNGVSFEGIAAAKDEAIKSLSEPHFVLGKIVGKYCPDFGTPFDKNAHITAVYPVGPRGVFALGSLAELANSHLAISELPVRNEEMAKFATKEFLVENSTASVNGCHLIVATKDVLNMMAEDLKKHNFAPETIGSVGKKGAAAVAFAKDAGQFVASKAKLARLTSPAEQQQPPA